MRTGRLIMAVYGWTFAAGAAPPAVVVGNVRVQALSPSLVRIEQRGPRGFEDRSTFTVVERDWAGEPLRITSVPGGRQVAGARWRLFIPGDGASLDGVRIETPKGKALKTLGVEPPPPAFLPAPGAATPLWLMADAPRLVPPPWGATPAPADRRDETSGWDLGNSAPDVYAFFPGSEGVAQLRRDLLRLTGPVPLPPLFAFGLIHSRYHDYSETTALETIDTYRRKGIPLDVFVCDTDWRVGASHGYAINTNLFPDLRRFIREAHDRHVRLMFNDHPEPQAPTALDPRELDYRYQNLTSLLDLGADAWWYDRNWSVALREPLPGLAKEVWGMRLYRDITARARPDRRPLILSNVHGIDNGARRHASAPAAHRFPAWWTGDTPSTWEGLRAAVDNGVVSGLLGLLPYVSEDLGGHTGQPDAELYVRFLQYGVFSPICRPHCTRGRTRDPWAFGAEAEAIVADYIRLRYRLLPTIYAAARRAYDDGTPLLRRADIEWPARPEAARADQYLFGDDLLVAPVMHACAAAEGAPIPPALLRAPDGAAGCRGDYFSNPRLDGAPALTRTDANIRFDWALGAPAGGVPADGFSVRWTGRLGPLPETGEYEFTLATDDGARLLLDDRPVIEAFHDQVETVCRGCVRLEAGQTCALRLEYYDSGAHAVCRLGWRRPSESAAAARGAVRDLWLPPGTWCDLWSGARLQGPRTITVLAPLRSLPLYARAGGVVLTLPQAQHTDGLAWNSVVAEAFVPAEDGEQTRWLYEDDGVSNGYLQGACARTPVTLTRKGKVVMLRVGAREGGYPGAPAERAWVARLHAPDGASRPAMVRLDGALLAPSSGGPAEWLPPGAAPPAIPLAGPGAAPPPQAGPTLEVRIPARDVRRGWELILAD